MGHLAKDCWNKPQNQKVHAKGRSNESRNVPHIQQTLLSSTMVLTSDSDNDENWIITDSLTTHHMSSWDVNMRNYKAK